MAEDLCLSNAICQCNSPKMNGLYIVDVQFSIHAKDSYLSLDQSLLAESAFKYQNQYPQIY